MDAKETSFYTAILIVCAVLGVIIAYFIISIIRQQRRNLRLYKQSIQTEITTLENERARMAADLHDEVGPILSSIKLRINSIDIANEADHEVIQTTNDHIDRLVTRMREISFDLMPTSLIRKGFAAALNEFIEYCGKSSTIAIRFQYTMIELTELQSINLYRIVQEIIHNAIKHAEATELLIEFRQEGNMIVLAARDNGKGFNYEEKSKESKGLGLNNLLRRTELIGGKMYFESKKGKGTTYTFEIPTANDKIRHTGQDHTG